MLNDIAGIIDKLAGKSTLNEYREFVTFCFKNKFAANLTFKFGDEIKTLTGFNYLFGDSYASQAGISYTNFEKVREAIKLKFIEEESEKLFEKLETLKEYLQEEN